MSRIENKLLLERKVFRLSVLLVFRVVVVDGVSEGGVMLCFLGLFFVIGCGGLGCGLIFGVGVWVLI